MTLKIIREITKLDHSFFNVHWFIEELSAHKVEWEVNLLFIWKRENLLLESSQVSTKVAFPWWCIICCPRFINKIRQVKKIYLAYKHGI